METTNGYNKQHSLSSKDLKSQIPGRIRIGLNDLCFNKKFWHYDYRLTENWQTSVIIESLSWLKWTGLKCYMLHMFLLFFSLFFICISLLKLFWNIRCLFWVLSQSFGTLYWEGKYWNEFVKIQVHLPGQD